MKNKLVLMMAAMVIAGWMQVGFGQSSIYEIIEGSFTWHEAKADAEARGGHLATITSEVEQGKISELLLENDSLYWVGGTDENEEGVWEWITGESFVYVNWDYEHNYDKDRNQDYMIILSKNGLWGDFYSHSAAHEDGTGAQAIFGYILEVPKVNKVMIFRGEEGVKVKASSYPGLRCRLEESRDLITWFKVGNDVVSKSYVVDFKLDANETKYVIIDGSFTWHEAKADAEARGGHLATVTSQKEYDKIRELAGTATYFLGGTDENLEGNWNWVTGEKWDYTNWLPEEPNNFNGEHYLTQVYDKGVGWNDVGVKARTGYILEIPPPSTRFFRVIRLD